MLVEEGPDVGTGDAQGPGSGQAGADVDAALIGQQRQVGEITSGAGMSKWGLRDRTQAVVAVYESGLFVPRSARPSR